MAGTRADANATRAETAMENRVLNAAKIIAARPDNMNLTDEQIYAKARQMVTGQSAQNQFTGFSGRPLK
jgi:hypothetical protein